MENKRPQLTPEQDALEHIFACKDKPFLEGRYIDALKGRGLFTQKAIKPSMFVAEYRGSKYSIKTTTPKKACADSLVNYLFEFSWNGAQWCIDASAEDKTLGRLVNDDHISPNCEMKKMVIEGKPHLCLFSLKKISPGEEITFNYGDSSYPWRSTESFEGSSSSYTNVCPKSSTPRNKRLADWDAASSPCSDDDDELRDSDSFSNTSSQMDFADDSSLRDLDDPEEITGKSVMPPGDASCSQKEKKAPFRSDKLDSDGDYSPRKAPQKPEEAAYSNKSYCYFCGKGHSRIGRHLARHVEEDPKLAEAFSLQKNSKERNRILADFRNKGNYKHNQEVLKNNSGTLKLRKRLTTKGGSSKSLLHCMYCKCLLLRKEMWRHVRRCHPGSTSDAATGGRSKVLRDMDLAEAPLAQNLPADVKKMLSDMTQDRIAFAVQNDDLLIKLTEHLSAKYRDDPDKHRYVRQSLREMGRLLLALHEKSISSYQDAIKPTNFYKVVEVVKKLTGFNVKRNSYEKPSLALKFGYSLKKIGAIVAEAEDLDEQMKGDAETFMNMCTKEWTQLVSHTALASLKGQRIHKASTIPFTRDVQLFYTYMESASASAVKGLKREEGQQVYTALCRVTLARVSVLNKCVPEVSKMTLKAFQERADSTQVLSKHFIRINMESTTGKNISLLLTSDVVGAITLLVSKRKACGVHKENPFLFAMPNSSPTSAFHKGHNIRAFSILCRAKNPEHLRAMHFHKHIAKVFQILNLENDELEHLAKSLGHNIRADRDYYRLPEAAVELAKIATLIVAMENGSLKKYKGKSLTEIEIEDELEPDVQQVNAEVSDAEEDGEESDFESVMEIAEAEEQTFNNEEFSHSWGSVESKEELQKSRRETKAAASSPVDTSESNKELRKSRRETKAAASSTVDKSVEDWGASSSSAESCSGDEFVPDGDASSDDSSTPNVKRRGLRSTSGRASRAKRQEDDSISVEMPKVQRRHSKNYCYVCGKAQLKIARHLFTHRHDEPEVAELFALRKNSEARAKRISELRDRGNSQHNEEVLKTGHGELMLKGRKTDLFTVTKECLYCKRLYRHKELSQHMSNCSARNASRPPRCNSKVLTLVPSVQVKDNPELSAKVSGMIKDMPKNEITSAVLNDSFLMLMAEYFCHMKECRNSKSGTIKEKLTAMGNLLLTLKKTSISTFEEVLKPENFSKVVEAVRELCGFNEENKTWNRPTVMFRVGCSLKLIADINYVRLLKEGNDKQKIGEAETFLKLCRKEWCRTYKSKISPTPTIPFVQDVQLFYQYLEKTAASASESLTKYECAPVYTALLRLTAAQLSVLNQNLDLACLTLKSFHEREETERCEDAAVSQSQIDQILSKKSVKINVMNHKGRKVVVTLTPSPIAALELLVTKREACGVHTDNPYLFALPDEKCTSYMRGGASFTIIAARCDAKKESILKSVYFRKHLSRVFQILSLTNDQLDELAKLLGRDIQTDREYYQKPDAAVDVAKIFELLSAMENGTLEKYEGKSFQEIDIADELEPHAEQVKPRKSDAGEDKEESEMSFQMNDPENGADFSQIRTPKSKGRLSLEGSSSRLESPSSISRQCPSRTPGRGRGRGKGRGSERGRGRGRGKRRRLESEDESELSDEKDEKVNSEPDDRSEKKTSAANTPQRTSSPSNDITTNMFSSDDDDMNVDFDVDMDTDEDIPRNEKNDGDDDTRGSATRSWLPGFKDEKKQDEASSDGEKNDDRAAHEPDAGKNMDTDSEDDVEAGDPEADEEPSGCMDEDSRSSSPIVNKEKKKDISAAVTGMKELKIVIPKLDLTKLKAPFRVSQLSPASQPAAKDQPIPADSKRSSEMSTSTNTENAPSSEKEIQMICSNCTKIMTKGQTAYQKKGFTDVFCSKDCLFEMFPINRPVTKSCFFCSSEITRPLDLIMAAVDIKGTMKDFCSTTCLCSFKTSNRFPHTLKPLCGMCNKGCSTKCGLMVKNVLYRFCSNVCLEDFRKENKAVCENCNSVCYKPLRLNLEEDTKAICSQECLDDFRKDYPTPNPCTLCHVSRPVSEMVTHHVAENVLELFCSCTCVMSYKLQPELVRKLQEKKVAERVKRKNGGFQREQEEETITSHSAVNNSDASPAPETVNAPSAVYVDSMGFCSLCKRKLRAGRTVCQYCCKSKKNPAVVLLNKTCYNCSEVILLPCSMILAPVDHSGAMKELCSQKCLAIVNSKMPKAAPKPPLPQCKMCKRSFIPQNLKLTLDDFKHTVCGDACFTNYHSVNNLPVVTCDICSSASLHKHFTAKTDEGSKSICSDECLVKFKESFKSPRLCPMCQTSHQMSDMVENINDEGTLDFFCSNRCMMVHKAQSLTVSGRNSPVCDKERIKQVKLRPNLDFIKQEPIEEECKPNVSSSISSENIKDEPNVAKEEMKTEESPVLTSSADPACAAPTFTPTDLLESCSRCRKVLMEGETVYQRKSHTDIFCSSACLLNFYQMKQVKRSCTFCLQAISQSMKVLQAPVDDEGTLKDFCCQTCMSSFNYKRMMNSKVPIVPVASHSQCNMCSRYCISKHEIIHKQAVNKICSDPCFLRFCNSHNLSICLNCHSDCNTPLIIRMEDGSKRLCSADCLAQYKQKIRTPQSCSTCSTKRLMSDMVNCKNSDGELELFCNNSCVAASKILAVSSSGAPVDCDNCGKSSVPACHLAMSDASIRNFCSLSCAMTVKDTQRDKHVPTNPAGASQQTQCDFLKPPEKLKCAQCRRVMKTAHKVIQNKGRMHFVCSVSCSHEFRRDSNILGKCEYCKNERIVKDVKRVNDKDCYFCSDGCKMLFQHDLKKQWGEYCQSCAYCLSISKTVIVERYGDSDQALCSYDCNLKYNLLFNHFAKCDTCGRKGKLTQSLPLIGEVSHFCDMKCLLRFCNQQAQMPTTVSPTPRSVSTEESSPVITNVISLAGALAKQTSSSAGSAQRGSNTQTSSPAPDIHTKVVGHASVQTVPKELKNKSMLCTPLVHNKGVSCSPKTVDVETQTENVDPKAAVLPLPVPVHVPLPVNMYSQCTPKPVGLPIPDQTHTADSCPRTPQEIDISESYDDDQQERSDVVVDSHSSTEERLSDMDQSHTADSCPQTPDEMNISESYDDDQQERTDVLMDSCSPTEESLRDMGQSHTADSSPQTPDEHPRTPQEIDISESYDDGQQERTDGLVDSCSPTEERLQDMVSLSPDMSEEEVEEYQQEEEEVEEKAVREPSVETPQVTVPSNPEPCIEVKTSSNKTNQRIYDKKNYCLYCEKPYGKIARHLLQQHSDRTEVAKVLTYNKSSPMRSLLLGKVRNMGNYKHNCSVLSSGKGQFIPKKQARYPASHMDYLPCKFCYAMYMKNDLWKHHKHCKLQVKEDGSVKRQVQASSSLMLPLDTSNSSGLKEILEDMTYDIVTKVVKSDALIIAYGERMYRKNRKEGRHRADIRNKMRQLARLVLAARKIDQEIISLKDLIHPGKFYTVLEAVKAIAGFDKSTKRFEVPSTALKLHQSLVKVSFILQGEALRQQDGDLQAQAALFSQLIEKDGTTQMSSDAQKESYQKKWNIHEILPLSEDIKTLDDHLKCLEEVHKQALIEHPSQEAWSELSKVTLTQLILFNRHREAEVSRIEVQTYLQRNKSRMQDEIVYCLSPFETILCKDLLRVEVRGERGRKIPVLLTRNVQESVELLIKTRGKVGISATNPYIFAVPCFGSQKNIQGCDSLKHFAESCGAKHPENITSTKQRKHVATVSQLLNLQTHELDNLATFMGHDMEVHRLPEATLHMAKVCILIFALQGETGKNEGKTLEDLTPNLNSEEEMDSVADEVQSEQPASTGKKAKEELIDSVADKDQSEQPASTSKKQVRVSLYAIKKGTYVTECQLTVDQSHSIQSKLPVPVFLPGTPDCLDEAVTSTKEEIKPDSSEGELNVKSEGKKGQDERKELKEREGFGGHVEPRSQLPHSSLPPAVETTQSSAQTPPILPQTEGTVLNKNKGRKLQHFSIEPEEETAHRDLSKAVLRKHQKLESQCGPEAWKRWIQWRKTQTHPEVVSSPAVTFKEEILHCSAMELSDGLCGFIKEVKQPDGEPYPPDNLFYLCLSIQQWLFENGRVENIFSDSIYNKFTTEFTKILKGFKPSLTASGYIHSHVEEEFLWDCKQLGAYSPIVLINTLLFFCSKYLGFTTVEQHRQLSFSHIVRHTKTNPDNTKSRFLLCYPPKSINEEESDEDGVPAKKRKKNDSITVMMENTENPLRCPVRLYGFYLSKCSESVRRHPGLFYLQPDRHCVPDSLVWFSSSPLDDSTLEAMLVRILAIRQMWGEDEGDLDQQTSVDQTFIPEEEESA